MNVSLTPELEEFVSAKYLSSNNLSTFRSGYCGAGASALPPGFRPAFPGTVSRRAGWKSYFLTSPKVGSGRCNPASEVVREALRLPEEHDSARAAQLAEFNRELGRRLASLDRGETVDPVESRTRLQRKSAERNARPCPPASSLTACNYCCSNKSDAFYLRPCQKREEHSRARLVLCACHGTRLGSRSRRGGHPP